jgi:hypothetical protein
MTPEREWKIGDPGLPPAEHPPSYYGSMDYQPPLENRDSKRPKSEAEIMLELFEYEEECKKKVARETEQLRIREEARRRVRTELAGERFRPPREGGSLAEQLKKPRPESRMAVEGLLPVGGNGLLVAQYKAGKTTLAMNLARAWADREPFLGRFEISAGAGNVAFFNYELSEAMFLDWIEEMGVKHPERIYPLHLRDWSLPFWDPQAQDVLAEWFLMRRIGLWIIDPAARAWRGFVENENDNTQVDAWTAKVDELKRSAGVSEALLTHHVGRQRQAEGEERGRGATRLEDWMDAGWYLTKDGDTRSLRANGRDVALDAIDLDYEGGRRHLYASGQTREERRDLDAMEDAIAILDTLLARGADPPTTTELTKRMTVEQKKRNPGIQKAVDEGYIRRE